MDYGDIKQTADQIGGWLTDGESKLLHNLACHVSGRGCVVEIGSWQGKSTLYLATGLMKSNSSAKFYAVDPHVGSQEHQKQSDTVWTYDIFLKNIKTAGVAHKVTPVVDFSVNFAAKVNEPVEMIFIDGAHDPKSVLDDFNAWYPKVVDGGVMAFHDSYAGGDPYKVLRKVLYPSRHFGIIRTADSITYATKIARNSIFVLLRNHAMLTFKDGLVILYKSRILNRIIFALKRILK